jgi:prepilin-type N-terminal cleavage/methylation domain-containing protein
MLPTHTRSRFNGFTLLELLVVVVVLGLLAAMVIPRFSDMTQDASKSSIRSTLLTVRRQIELYRAQHGTLPPDIAALVDTAPTYLHRDPNETVPAGFVFNFNADTGAYTAACTEAHPSCPEDIGEW